MYIYIYIYTHEYVCVYIYIYIERERYNINKLGEFFGDADPGASPSRSDRSPTDGGEKSRGEKRNR